MKSAKDLFDYDSLAFFGRVNASISHELKNIMAIISETAGLLSDLSEMAASGSSVDPEMLKSSAASIMEEIQRGFVTIRQMNRFSHSVDTPIVSIDLVEILDLVCHLSGYLSFSGKTQMIPWEGEPPIIQTCPFALQAIVYEILVQNFKNAGPGADLEIAIRPRPDNGWVIVFSGFSIGEFQVFPDAQIKKVSASIGITIDWDRTNDHLKLHVPLTIQSDLVYNDEKDEVDDGDTPPIRLEST